MQKVILLALLVAATTTATPVNQASPMNFGEALTNMYTAFQKMMPCGYPADNIPVLDPFRIEQQSFNSATDDYSFVGNITNLYITGLSNFHHVGKSYNEDTGFSSFDIIFPEIQILGEYDVNAFMNVAGFPLRWTQSGLINEKFIDLRYVASYTIASPVNATDKLSVTNVNLNFYLSDAAFDNWNVLWDISTNNFVNKADRELLLMLVEQIQPQVNYILDKYALPYINEYLGQMSMDQLINTLNSMAASFEKADCNVVA
ncbi:uncharacterized protein LOC115620230 [Scaptodrosophila lebanonensis]|uniref:Uncharacterized protein LOC115620230 n=1 Tax=Drosophila lebanonensis TaxID=7225 RepID=A0A6J2T2X2_DROLE|nr:uncharacterized protein LOC115620230 [Scaptodrosophila lebanonensis]